MANFKDNKKRLFEIMDKLNPKQTLTEDYDINAYTEQDNPQYKAKVEKIKGVIDQLYIDQDYDVINTLYRLMVERKPKFTAAVKQISEMLDKY